MFWKRKKKEVTWTAEEIMNIQIASQMVLDGGKKLSEVFSFLRDHLDEKKRVYLITRGVNNNVHGNSRRG